MRECKMTRQVVLNSPRSSLGRRQPLLGNREFSSGGGPRKVRLGEVAGGTAAECAAVCCCCPCGLFNLLVLAVYKLPAGLCKKALRRKRRQKLIKQGVLPPRACVCDCKDNELQIHPIPAVVNAFEISSDKDVVELENEMWDKFYSAGFWRSPSQRSEV